MKIRTTTKLSDIAPQAWKACADDSIPFNSREFYALLESSQSVGEETGSTLMYLYVENNAGQICAVMPFLLKGHSYGEYIFDWEWANAFEARGLPYYPKLLSMAPYSPVTVPNIFCKTSDAAEIKDAILQSFSSLAESNGFSSCHLLFQPKHDWNAIQCETWIKRHSFQYHWENRQYDTFDDFLQSMKKKKRRNIQQERADFQDLGITFEIVEGSEVTDEAAEAMYHFYLNTIEKKHAYAYLRKDFILEIFQKLPHQTALAIARKGDKILATAFFFHSKKTLWGRYWGSSENIKNLHFELCYYQGIEFCIQNKIARFEAGAQGEHKISRGFLPAYTYSTHRIFEPDFDRAIRQYVSHESKLISHTMEELRGKSPFKT